MKGLSHPNIVRYLGTQTDDEHLNIFLEYVPGGSIASLLSKFGPFDENLVRVYTYQVLQGLDYLHSHNIVHRDIKGGNILVDKTGVVKLADFGASKKIEGLLNATGGMRSLQGTPYWMAPEVIRQSGHGKKADIWSVGCTVLEMFTAQHPWGSFHDHISALFHIAQSKGPPPMPSHLSENANDFLLQCFERDPGQRPTAQQLLDHEWIRHLGRGHRRRTSNSNYEGYDEPGNGRSRTSSMGHRRSKSSSSTGSSSGMKKSGSNRNNSSKLSSSSISPRDRKSPSPRSMVAKSPDPGGMTGIERSDSFLSPNSNSVGSTTRTKTITKSHSNHSNSSRGSVSPRSEEQTTQVDVFESPGLNKTRRLSDLGNNLSDDIEDQDDVMLGAGTLESQDVDVYGHGVNRVVMLSTAPSEQTEGSFNPMEEPSLTSTVLGGGAGNLTYRTQSTHGGGGLNSIASRGSGTRRLAPMQAKTSKLTQERLNRHRYDNVNTNTMSSISTTNTSNEVPPLEQDSVTNSIASQLDISAYLNDKAEQQAKSLISQDGRLDVMWEKEGSLLAQSKNSSANTNGVRTSDSSTKSDSTEPSVPVTPNNISMRINSGGFGDNPMMQSYDSPAEEVPISSSIIEFEKAKLMEEENKKREERERREAEWQRELEEEKRRQEMAMLGK
eukprot:TRINITY_DN7444_c1_g1_i6.p1 TRINITY_DN7444_c1_g1~~TRINITY_DN7444_c1_g1_i6.p1  ORF type:complete len:666 (+),score=211.52 TRINITY_DN7444_c1_g1_i6:2126-4123(+)